MPQTPLDLAGFIIIILCQPSYISPPIPKHLTVRCLRMPPNASIRNAPQTPKISRGACIQILPLRQWPEQYLDSKAIIKHSLECYCQITNYTVLYCVPFMPMASPSLIFVLALR